VKDGPDLEAQTAACFLCKGRSFFRLTQHGADRWYGLAAAAQRPVQGRPVLRRVDDLAREQRTNPVGQAALDRERLHGFHRGGIYGLLGDIGFDTGRSPHERGHIGPRR
jgi:hypothetical protein